MNIFQKRIENLCDEIIGRILALMQVNSVSEVMLTDNDNSVYVIWFDKMGDPCECSVHKVTAVGERIASFLSGDYQRLAYIINDY